MKASAVSKFRISTAAMKDMPCTCGEEGVKCRGLHSRRLSPSHGLPQSWVTASIPSDLSHQEACAATSAACLLPPRPHGRGTTWDTPRLSGLVRRDVRLSSITCYTWHHAPASVKPHTLQHRSKMVTAKACLHLTLKKLHAENETQIQFQCDAATGQPCLRFL